MKKTLLALITTLLISQSTYSAPVFNNSTRELFAQNKANVYVMNMRTFSAQDKDRNEIIDRTKGEKSGTFLGAIKRLDSLEEAGINIFKSLYNDSGYTSQIDLVMANGQKNFTGDNDKGWIISDEDIQTGDKVKFLGYTFKSITITE